jgi:hypothetical protein
VSKTHSDLTDEEALRIERSIPMEARIAGQRAQRAALERFGRVVTVRDGELGVLTSSGQFLARRSVPKDVAVVPGFRVKLNKKRH